MPPFYSSVEVHAGVGGAVMIYHYVSQPKTQNANVSTKCQVSSLKSLSVNFFCMFFYWIVGVRKEKDRKEKSEMERDGRIWRLGEM